MDTLSAGNGVPVYESVPGEEESFKIEGFRNGPRQEEADSSVSLRGDPKGPSLDIGKLAPAIIQGTNRVTELALLKLFL